VKGEAHLSVECVPSDQGYSNFLGSHLYKNMAYISLIKLSHRDIPSCKEVWEVNIFQCARCLSAYDLTSIGTEQGKVDISWGISCVG
jgi:hypothetical protein